MAEPHASATRRRASAAAPFVLLLAMGAPAEPAVAQDAGQAGSGMSFLDDFTTFDRKRWVVSNGWSNGAHQDCTWHAGNVRRATKSISLVLNNRHTAQRLFSCGEVQSHGFYGYGTYEVRMRSAAGPGIVSAFFIYTGPPHGRPHDETAIEFLGKSPNSVQFNYFVAGRGGHERNVDLGFDASIGPNNFAIQWMPDALRWFVNGRLVHEVRQSAGEPLPSHAGKIALEIWNGVVPGQEAWLGRFEYVGQPLVATYEYVAFTGLGKPCQFPASVVCAQSGQPAR